MYSLNGCPVCDEKERTIVCEYNRLIFVESMWQNDIARFDYALCHGCGLVYATRRPERDEYEHIYNNFNEFLMRPAKDGRYNSPELTPERMQQADRDFVPWWKVRSVPRTRNSVRKLLHRELENVATYLPHIAVHVPLENAKVLHIRTKSSTLADVLKRIFGVAQVDLITLFETHTYIAGKLEGFRATPCLDYENFQIPYEDKYDLIIENHVFLHMLDPKQTFRVFQAHLEENGHLFLQKELADNVLFRRGKNLFAELRPFHFQQFDEPTLKRMLFRYGFETIAFGRYKSEIFGVAKRATPDPRPCPRIGQKELGARLAMYAQWRDESILSLPKERSEALFGNELDQITERVKANGGLELNKKGKVSAIRAFHEAELNDDELAIADAF